jgi:DNA-binding MarR family transcriptional regulator
METDRAAGPEAAALAGELRPVLARLSRRLRQQADPVDLTGSQINVLVRLERDGPATVSGLARAEGVRPQSMGATVAALEAAGLLRRDPDPADGRKAPLSLTPEAREQFAAHRLAKEDWLQRAMARELDADELARLRDALALLARIADAG